VRLGAIDSSFIGDTVRVEANITASHRTEAAQFMTLQAADTRMKAVYFGNSDIDINPAQQYRVDGTVDVYKGELEIIVQDVTAIAPENTPS
jgi:RecJ-like exonuclease